MNDDVGRVIGVARPPWWPVRAYQCMRESLAGLPIARAETRDVGIEQVVCEVGPGMLASQLGGQYRRIARSDPRVMRAVVGRSARDVAAGEGLEALLVHVRSGRAGRAGA